MRNIIDRRKYIPNDSFFKFWSCEMAYVLGFIAADGCVTDTTYGKQKGSRHHWVINLKKDDSDILFSISRIIDSIREPYFNKKANQYVLYVNSAEMVADLRAFGFSQHKSRELKWPTNVPSQYLSHFVRGYFDGDGCIFWKNDHNPRKKSIGINVVATRDFTEGLKSCVSQIYGQEVGYIQDHETYCTFYLQGRLSIECFLDWIYADSTPETRLSRKYQLYMDFKKYKSELSDEKSLDSFTWDEINSIREASKTTSITDLALQSNRSVDAIGAIIKDKSWSSNAKQKPYTAFGETKTMKEWLKDPRCQVNEHTLDYRVRLKKLDLETALTLPADKGKRWKDGQQSVYTREGEKNRWAGQQ
jgi:hypothetical protein